MTYCKPSSGAGVVGMDIPLRGWLQPPAMKNGDPLKVLLLLSHFIRAQDQPEECKTDTKCMEHKVASSSSTEDEDFMGHCLSSIVIMSICAYSALGRVICESVICVEFSLQRI